MVDELEVDVNIEPGTVVRINKSTIRQIARNQSLINPTADNNVTDVYGSTTRDRAWKSLKGTRLDLRR